jgi:hypothetical protein
VVDHQGLVDLFHIDEQTLEFTVDPNVDPGRARGHDAGLLIRQPRQPLGHQSVRGAVFQAQLLFPHEGLGDHEFVDVDL